MEGKGDGVPAPALAKVAPDHLFEEALSPFFIRLPPKSSSRLLMVDFSVVWDGVAAVRFKKRELEIREYLFHHLSDLVRKKKNLQDRVPYLETEIARILQESLGREGLEIKIKEAKAF
jgi:hypothetical protein